MKQEEIWIYAGRRVSKGKQAYAWIDANDKELWYGPGFQGKVIGGRYTVTVDRDSDKLTVYGKPSYVDRSQDERTAEWEAKQETSNTLLAAASRERTAAKQRTLDEALVPLLDVARTLRTGSERDAFLAHIIRKVSAAW